MYLPIEIVPKNYIPLDLEEGMLFESEHYPLIYGDGPYIEIHCIQDTPMRGIKYAEKFYEMNGYPVELILQDIETGEIISEDESSEWWWDDGEDSDELRSITLDDINTIFREYEGICEIDVDVDELSKGNFIPKKTDGSIVLKLYNVNEEE
jgi:hypothetical protein